MSNAGNRILKSIRQARAYARGEATEGFVAHVPEDVDVRAIRLGLGLRRLPSALGSALPLFAIGNSIGDSRSRQRGCCCLLSPTIPTRCATHLLPSLRKIDPLCPCAIRHVLMPGQWRVCCGSDIAKSFGFKPEYLRVSRSFCSHSGVMGKNFCPSPGATRLIKSLSSRYLR
jgi:putative transcriptional regulator